MLGGSGDIGKRGAHLCFFGGIAIASTTRVDAVLGVARDEALTTARQLRTIPDHCGPDPRDNLAENGMASWTLSLGAPRESGDTLPGS
jgi:hypothetical protein